MYKIRVLENRYVELRSMADGSQLRTATFNGVEHIVVPIVTAVGDNVWWPANAPTPEFVPASVLASHAFSRNNRPVVMGHPKTGGDYTTANDPKILEEYGFGQMFASSYESGRIVVEAWLDPVKAELVGPDAVSVCERLKAGKKVEVSEGDYVVTVTEQGEYGGKKYGARWVSAVNDHLAMLPEGDIGACSNEMGCGPRVAVLRSNMDKVDDGMPTLRTSVLTQARRPSFTGTETVAWVKPSFSDYVKYLDNSATPPKSVAQCSSTLKEKIASHTLLGDPSASSFSDLAFFPVVNPANDKLNERALRAVLGARGSSADIPAETLASAQEIARRLLNSEFSSAVSANSSKLETAKQEATAMEGGLVKRLISKIRSAMSNNDLRWKLYKIISDLEPGVEYVDDEDVEGGTVRYVVLVSFGSGWSSNSEIEYHFYQRTFSIDASSGAITVNDDRVEVVFDETRAWIPKDEAPVEDDVAEFALETSCSCKGDRNMSAVASKAIVPTATQKDLTDKLITSSASPFEESDRPVLESMSEDKLQSLAETYKEAEPAAAVVAPVAPSSVTASAAATPAQRVLTEEEYLTLKSAADAFQAQQKARHGHLVASLKTAQTAFTEAELHAMDMSTLEKMATAFKVGEPATVDFSVRGIPSSRMSGNDTHPLPDTWGLNSKATN